MICKRCGKEYEDPYPEIVGEGVNYEIATLEYCADCNALVMTLVHRESSAYYKNPKKEKDDAC